MQKSEELLCLIESETGMRWRGGSLAELFGAAFSGSASCTGLMWKLDQTRLLAELTMAVDYFKSRFASSEIVLPASALRAHSLRIEKQFSVRCPAV